MSPHAALASPVFQFYVILAAGLLLVAGVVLAVLKWGFGREVDHAWQAYRGWLLMVPPVLGCIFVGRTATILLVTLIAAGGFKEFARATGLYADWLMTVVVYAGMLSLAIVCFVADPFERTPGWYGMFMALPVYVIAMLMMVPIVRNQAQGQLQMLALAIVGFIYFGWMFQHLAFLANARYAYSYILYLLFAVELNDVAAYTFGKLFGRHPLRSNISPKKTWEGALGALVVSLILPWLLRGIFPDATARDLILFGLIVGMGGQMGDLAISVIKRDLGIKDMGAAIPGHGGVLDRIDSLVYAAPLFFHTIRYFHGL